MRIDTEPALTDPPASTVARPSRVAWLLGAAAIVTVAVLTTLAIRFLQAPVASGPEMRVEITPLPLSAPLEFALSPDGQHIVFVASGDGRRRLWLRALKNLDARVMTGTDGAAYPFWSPDGRSIGYFASRKLYRIDVAGGSPQELADAPVGIGGTWNAEGTILFAPAGDSHALMRIAAGGGTRQKTSPDSIRRGRLAINRLCSYPMAAFSSTSLRNPRPRRSHSC